MERPLTRLVFVAALFAACVLVCSDAAVAADCPNKPTALDVAICGDRELSRLDEAIWKLIDGLSRRFTSNQGREPATMAADQLRWREELWRQCAPLTVACLTVQFQARYAHLKPDVDRQASELYLRTGIRIGGVPLEMRSGRNGGLFLGVRQIAGPTQRIDVVERYTDDSVDALAFVAERGGSGPDCGRYPLYIVVVRPQLAPEVLTLPDVVDISRGHQSCVPTVARTADGLFFEFETRPWRDGRTYIWQAKGGELLASERLAFKPKPGTLVGALLAAPDGTGRLDNEQFYEALRKAVTALQLDFARAAEAFWFSWNAPRRRGDFFLFDSCAQPGAQGACGGDFVGKAVYEQRTDRLYFAFSAAKAPPPCADARGSDPIDAALHGLLFFPSRFRWPDGALFLLKDAYCTGDR